MPVVKAHEALEKRPPIVLLYGDPGVGKTSLFNTSDTPLLIDFDRGVQRSHMRKDTLVVNKWEDVIVEEQAHTFIGYKTIGVDTAKACLDDYLMNYVVSLDYKNAVNKLQAYGAIGDSFKLFINARRQENAAIVIIAHSKKDEDTKKMIPDVTGQSYSLLLRIADQVGYIFIQNGKRVITWDPTDRTAGKNVACLGPTELPEKSDPSWKTFMGTLIETIQEALGRMSDEQLEAMRKSDELTEQVTTCSEVGPFNELCDEIGTLPDYLKIPMRSVIKEKAAAMGWTFDKANGNKFIAPAPDPAAAKENKTPPVTPDPKETSKAKKTKKEIEAEKAAADLFKAQGDEGGSGDPGDDSAPSDLDEVLPNADAVRERLLTITNPLDLPVFYMVNDKIIDGDPGLMVLFHETQKNLTKGGEK